VTELLNVVGLTIGIVLYAMLLAMVFRRDGPSQRMRPLDPLLVATAVLGLVWNGCALPVYELPKIGFSGNLAGFTLVGFSALGFLPAVVVQSVLRGEHDRVDGSAKRVVAGLAYGISAAAALLHLRALLIGLDVPSPTAMRLLTYAYILLAVPVATVSRAQPRARRALWVGALSIFAVTALHLSQSHRGDSSWPVELLGHHASVPLALAILYQDYPFALADLFLKRALTLLILITAAFLSVTALHATAASSPFGGTREVGSLVTLWVITALLYPRLRDGIAWFVDTVVLKRPDYSGLIAEIVTAARVEQDITVLLDRTCALLGPALNARRVTWQEQDGRAAAPPDEGRPGALSATVEIPATETPQYVVMVAGLTAGRRLLSGDLAALRSIASIVGRRVDAIRLARERYALQLREQEIAQLATEAELRALRSQINPHFLFNALTTIGYLIQTAPDRALDTLLRLTSLLRGVLRSEGEFTTLGRELAIIEAYLDIERARFEQRLHATIEVPAALRQLRIPSLMLQPLVENAVKHGIAPLRDGGEVRMSAQLDDHNAAVLRVTVEDTGVGASEHELRDGRGAGVGLANVERRLTAHYGRLASIAITSAPGRGTRVELRLPAEPMHSDRATVAFPGRHSS
jgi:signal transduction histidine kinase